MACLADAGGIPADLQRSRGDTESSSAPRLHGFYARCPEAEVRLQASVHSIDSTRNGPADAASLRRAGIDVAVRFGCGEYAERHSRHLMQVSPVPVCSPAAKGISRSSSPQALLEQRLLSDSTRYRSSERFGATNSRP